MDMMKTLACGTFKGSRFGANGGTVPMPGKVVLPIIIKAMSGTLSHKELVLVRPDSVDVRLSYGRGNPLLQTEAMGLKTPNKKVYKFIKEHDLWSAGNLPTGASFLIKEAAKVILEQRKNLRTNALIHKRPVVKSDKGASWLSQLGAAAASLLPSFFKGKVASEAPQCVDESRLDALMATTISTFILTTGQPDPLRVLTDAKAAIVRAFRACKLARAHKLLQAQERKASGVRGEARRQERRKAWDPLDLKQRELARALLDCDQGAQGLAADILAFARQRDADARAKDAAAIAIVRAWAAFKFRKNLLKARAAKQMGPLHAELRIVMNNERKAREHYKRVLVRKGFNTLFDPVKANAAMRRYQQLYRDMNAAANRVFCSEVEAAVKSRRLRLISEKAASALIAAFFKHNYQMALAERHANRKLASKASKVVLALKANMLQEKERREEEKEAVELAANARRYFLQQANDRAIREAEAAEEARLQAANHVITEPLGAEPCTSTENNIAPRACSLRRQTPQQELETAVAPDRVPLRVASTEPQPTVAESTTVLRVRQVLGAQPCTSTENNIGPRACSPRRQTPQQEMETAVAPDRLPLRVVSTEAQPTVAESTAVLLPVSQAQASLPRRETAEIPSHVMIEPLGAQPCTSTENNIAPRACSPRRQTPQQEMETAVAPDRLPLRVVSTEAQPTVAESTAVLLPVSQAQASLPRRETAEIPSHVMTEPLGAEPCTSTEYPIAPRRQTPQQEMETTVAPARVPLLVASTEPTVAESSAAVLLPVSQAQASLPRRETAEVPSHPNMTPEVLRLVRDHIVWLEGGHVNPSMPVSCLSIVRRWHTSVLSIRRSPSVKLGRSFGSPMLSHQPPRHLPVPQVTCPPVWHEPLQEVLTSHILRVGHTHELGQFSPVPSPRHAEEQPYQRVLLYSISPNNSPAVASTPPVDFANLPLPPFAFPQLPAEAVFPQLPAEAAGVVLHESSTGRPVSPNVTDVVEALLSWQISDAPEPAPPVAATTGQSEMDTTMGAGQLSTDDEDKRPLTASAPQPRAATSLSKPTFDMAAFTPPLPACAEPVLLSFPTNTWGRTQAAQPNVISTGLLASNGMDSKPAALESPLSMDSAAPPADTMAPQLASATVPHKNTFNMTKFGAIGAAPMPTPFQPEACTASPLNFGNLSFATQANTSVLCFSATSLPNTSVLGFTGLPVEGQLPSLPKFNFGMSGAASSGPYVFSSHTACVPLATLPMPPPPLAVAPGDHVWFTSSLVLGPFRVVHLSRLLPYNSSIALGMLLDHRREPWMVYNVTDTEALLMPFSRPSNVPAPADVRREDPHAAEEPHVKLILKRDDFHLFEVQHDAAAQSRHVNSVKPWASEAEASHLPPRCPFSVGDIVSNIDPRLRMCKDMVDVMQLQLPGCTDLHKATDLFYCMTGAWEVMNHVTHAQAGDDVTLTVEPVEPVFRINAGQFIFTADCVERDEDLTEVSREWAWPLYRASRGELVHAGFRVVDQQTTLEEAVAAHNAHMDALPLNHINDLAHRENLRGRLKAAITDSLCVGEGRPGSGEAFVRCLALVSDMEGIVSSIFTTDMDLRVPLGLLTYMPDTAGLDFDPEIASSYFATLESWQKLGLLENPDA